MDKTVVCTQRDFTTNDPGNLGKLRRNPIPKASSYYVRGIYIRTLP